MVSATSTTDDVVSRVLTEDVLTLSQARSKLFKITGKRPDKATMTRWIHQGVGGVKLTVVRIGSQLLTSKQALHRYIVARTGKSIGNR